MAPRANQIEDFLNWNFANIQPNVGVYYKELKKLKRFSIIIVFTQ